MEHLSVHLSLISRCTASLRKFTSKLLHFVFTFHFVAYFTSVEFTDSVEQSESLIASLVRSDPPTVQQYLRMMRVGLLLLVGCLFVGGGVGLEEETGVLEAAHCSEPRYVGLKHT